MHKVKVISESYGSEFEKYVQELLDDDYKILHAYCGVINHPDGTSESIYSAILTKEDERCESL